MRRLPAVIALLLVLVGCASMDGDPASPVEGMRVAYVVNMANSDIFTEAAAGAVETANALGMDCSVFFSGGDDEAFSSIIEELAEMDYDGFLLSHGGREYTYGLISSILSEHPDIRFVTFDTELIGPNGEAEGIDGVTQFFQNDRHLASILLDYILSDVVDEEPARIIKVWVPDYIVAFDRRNEGYMEYEEAGRIITAATVSPNTVGYPEEEAYKAMKAFLEENGDIEADAVWVAYDAYARGCMRAMEEAGCTIPLVSVDISESDMEMMGEDDSIWKASACTDFRSNGEQGIRILALELADEYGSIRDPKTGRPSAWIEMPASLITQDDLPAEGESLADSAPPSYGDPGVLATNGWLRSSIGY